jgi:hypothetical protein
MPIRSADFPFPENQFPAELGAVVQKTVADGSMPALIVIHDDDNEWLIGDGVNPPLPEACGIYHIAHVVDRDRTLLGLAALPIGYAAERDSPKDPWQTRRWIYSDEE